MSEQLDRDLDMAAEETSNWEAESVVINQGGANNVEAHSITVKMGGIKQAEAQEITVKQGGILSAKADSIRVVQGGIGLARADQVEITGGGTVGVLATNVRIDAGGAQWMLARDRITVDQGAALVAVSNHVDLNNTFVGVLLAREVNGDVRVMFDRQAALVFGLAAGVIFGIISLFRSRR